MTDAIADYKDIVAANLTAMALHFVAELAGFEHNDFQVIGAVYGNRIAAIQNEKANVDGIAVFKRPHMETLATDLTAHEGISRFPRRIMLSQHDAE
jgi:hypothetical protein